jgi:PAS domain S-box-containing protein
MTLSIDYSRFFDLSHDPLCVAGTDGYFKVVNRTFTRELGWTSEELTGRPFVEFVHPDDAAATREETAQLGDGLPTIVFSNRYRCKDGTWKRLHWTSFLDPRTSLIYALARVAP